MESKRICYVVHRYPPFAGGSEYYVQAMAEESLRRGHDVTVLAGEHNGDLNGVKLTSSFSVLSGINPFDLVVVHGADVSVQNNVLMNAKNIKVPLLYLLILPSNSQAALTGMKDAAFLGCSTVEDFKHASAHGYQDKIVSVRHSLPSTLENTLGKPGAFRKKYGITTKHMWLSAGGFWDHKGMGELADIVKSLNRDDVTMVFTGYANDGLAPHSEGNIKSFHINDRQDVLDAIVDADLYIMNSTVEGFGLVILEAMANMTCWAARRIAGAAELQAYGFTYNNPQTELRDYLMNVQYDPLKAKIGFEYVESNRLISNTVDDIEIVLKKCSRP